MRNRADQLVYAAEKFVSETGDKLAAPDKAAIQSAIDTLKNAVNSNDVAAMTQGMEQLTQAQHKAAEGLYKQSAATEPGAAGAAGPGATGPDGAGGSARDGAGDVIDAEVVDDK